MDEILAGRDGGDPAAAAFTRALVCTADPILAAGVTTYLRTHGVEPIDGADGRLDDEAVGIVLVDLRRRSGSDRLAGCEDLARVGAAAGRETPGVAISWGPLEPLAVLRATESGATHLLRLDRMADDAGQLTRLVAGNRSVARLDPPDVQRSRLGLAPRGEVAPLVAALAELPEWVWAERPKLSSLPRSRREIAALRRLATSSGFPPPNPLRYSTEFRSAPRDPEWSTVWAAGCELLGHSSGAAPWSAGSAAPIDLRDASVTT